jgi:hypothetical protein
MSRWEFMRRLEELLSDIAPTEREEALRFYNDYINDGGKENEATVLEALGSPEKVAATVKEGLDSSSGEFTESGFKRNADQSANPVAPYREPGADQQASGKTPPPKNKMSAGVIALLVILIIIASPVLLGLGAGLLGVAIGLLAAVCGIFLSICATLFGFLLGLAVVAIILMILGLVLIPVGIIRLFTGPISGLALISTGLVLTGVGLLFFLLTTILVCKLVPALFKLTAKFIQFIFTGRRVVQNA